MTAPIRRRTRARELALQFLYTIELRGGEAVADLDAFIDHHTRRNPDVKGREEIAGYSKTLIGGVQEHLHEINAWIERIAANWRLERMSHVDRNVLRLAMYELLHQTETPFKVVINEGIDLAKRFSTSQSGGFVNGILDRARAIIQEQREAGIALPFPPDRVVMTRNAEPVSTMDEHMVPTPRPNANDAPASGEPEEEIAGEGFVPPPEEFIGDAPMSDPYGDAPPPVEPEGLYRDEEETPHQSES